MQVPGFDPEIVDLLEMVAAAFPATGLTTETLPLLRAAFAQIPADVELDPDGRWQFEEHLVAGRNGAPDVSVLLCLPAAPIPSTIDSELPVIYYVHGGGFVAGHRRSNLADILAMAAAVGAAVASVEYRLSPEAPYPGPLDDCLAGLDWLRSVASIHGLDPTRIIAAGTSAGAGLVTAAALDIRDQGGTPTLGQLLMAPMLDDRDATWSTQQMVNVGVWDQVSNRTAWASYLGDLGPEEVPVYAAPARAEDLGGLPPTFLDCGDAETFRDEVIDFASRIWRAGGSAELHVWQGGFHGFDSMAPFAAVARDAKDARVAWLRRLLRTDGRAS